MLLLEAWVPLRRRARGGPRVAGGDAKGAPRGAGAVVALLMLLLGRRGGRDGRPAFRRSRMAPAAAAAGESAGIVASGLE